MIGEMPFTSEAESVSFQLGNKKYLFETAYNDRSGVWTFDMYDDPTHELIIASIPLVLGQDLLEPYTLGVGRIICIDSSGQGLDAGPDDLGNRVKVYWYSEDEVLS